MQADPNRVKAVQTAIDVVRVLTDLDAPTTQAIADELDVSTSAVHNHLLTLEEAGFVIRTDEGFEPGLGFLEVGGQVRSERALYEHGRPEIDRLAKETGELVNLLTEENGQGVHLYLAKGDEAVQFDTYTGRRFDLHTNALGKAILAHLPRDRVREILDQHGLESRTENTITDEETLFSELDDIRDRGIAFDDEERLPGLRCVAAPVLLDDVVVGSISVSGPASRVKGERFRTDLPDKVAKAAELVSINIQY